MGRWDGEMVENDRRLGRVVKIGEGVSAFQGGRDHIR